MVYPALLPRIRMTYGMTLTTAGALLTALWLAYAFGQLPAGMLADRVGEGRVMMVSTLVSAGTITQS
ncbi:MFS transporter [Halalkalicoccus salilacus]|uniref:MFS transporter n=1 Tax=Halalkalicoccus sp. GCM10025704 TaxID=3252662 RepID=UPI003617E59C